MDTFPSFCTSFSRNTILVDKKSRPVWPSQELLGVFPGLMSQGSSIYQALLPREADLRARGEVWVWFLLRIFCVFPGKPKNAASHFFGGPLCLHCMRQSVPHFQPSVTRHFQGPRAPHHGLLGGADQKTTCRGGKTTTCLRASCVFVVVCVVFSPKKGHEHQVVGQFFQGWFAFHGSWHAYY